MDEEYKIELYDSYLRVRGSILLSFDNATVFKRARPEATIETDTERPPLMRVTLNHHNTARL